MVTKSTMVEHLTWQLRAGVISIAGWCTLSFIFSQIFCDFGEKFVISDVTGEQPLSVLISSVTKVRREEGGGGEEGGGVGQRLREGRGRKKRRGRLETNKVHRSSACICTPPPPPHTHTHTHTHRMRRAW